MSLRAIAQTGGGGGSSTAMDYVGTYNASTNTPDLESGTGISQGATYEVSVAGDFFTQAVEVGDLLSAKVSTPSTVSDWTIVKGRSTVTYALAESRTSDYSATEGNLGKIWTRTDQGDTKTVTRLDESLGGSYTAGVVLPAAEREIMGSGTRDDTLNWGGNNTSSTRLATTRSFDGVSWTAENNISQALSVAGDAGISTSASISFCGYNASNTRLNNTYEFDGTNWSSGGAYVSQLRIVAGTGTQTDTIGAGGNDNANNSVATAATYDGATWSSIGNLSATRNSAKLAGQSSSDAICIGGRQTTTDQTVVESYNGVSWSAETSLPQTQRDQGAWGTGSGLALSAAGYVNSSIGNTTYRYNGTAWSTDSNALASTANGAGTGTTANGQIVGGTDGANIDNNQEYDDGGVTTNYTVESVVFGKIESLTVDPTANASNAGRTWMRTDLTTPTVKSVVAYDDGGGTTIYAVRTYTTT